MYIYEDMILNMTNELGPSLFLKYFLPHTFDPYWRHLELIADPHLNLNTGQ